VVEVTPPSSSCETTGTFKIFTYRDDANVPNSPDFLPIGTFERTAYKFDAFKYALLYKFAETTGVSFQLTDNNNNQKLLEFSVSSDAFPALNTGYMEYTQTSLGHTIVFRIKLEEMINKHVSVQKFYDATYEISSNSQYDGVEYDEIEIELTEAESCTTTYSFQNGTDRFLLQSWR
jgi:hypothetical protein